MVLTYSTYCDFFFYRDYIYIIYVLQDWLLYTVTIRPLITYACPLWVAASKTKIKKLQTLQNKFLRI